MILNGKFLQRNKVKHLKKVLEQNCCYHRLEYGSFNFSKQQEIAVTHMVNKSVNHFLYQSLLLKQLFLRLNQILYLFQVPCYYITPLQTFTASLLCKQKHFCMTGALPRHSKEQNSLVN